MDERLIGRHAQPRTVDDVDAATPATPGGAAASAASVPARRPRRRAPTARELYNFALIGFGGLAFFGLASGNFIVGAIFFLLLVAFVKLSRVGD